MSWSRTCYGCEHSEDSESEYRCHKDVQNEQLKAENERLKKQLANTGWRYYEPDRSGALIIGFFVFFQEDCSYTYDVRSVFLVRDCSVSDDVRWFDGVKTYYPDCSLLCWREIDLEV